MSEVTWYTLLEVAEKHYRRIKCMTVLYVLRRAASNSCKTVLLYYKTVYAHGLDARAVLESKLTLGDSFKCMEIAAT